MPRSIVVLALLAAACSRNAAYRERARAAPMLDVSTVFEDAHANPASVEHLYRDKLVRFSGRIIDTGVIDRTVTEDRRGACAAAAGLQAMGSSMNPNQQRASVDCAPYRLRNTRVTWAALGDGTHMEALVCEFGKSFEETIASLRKGEQAVIAGHVTKVIPDAKLGSIVIAEDCVVPVLP